MKTSTLILRSLIHFRRTHLGILLGVALSATVLVGALIVGDSVRLSLREQAEERIGLVDWALQSHDRFFQTRLAVDLQKSLPQARLAPALQLAAIATTPDGATRAGDVHLYGIDERFFGIVASREPETIPEKREVYLSSRLARSLGVSIDDTVILRVEKPSALPRDMVLATNEDSTLALRVRVAAILDRHQGDRFSLFADPLPPLNAFVSLSWVQEELAMQERANLILVAGQGATLAQAQDSLKRAWTLEDGELQWLTLEESGAVELRTPRVFLDPGVGEASERAPPALNVLTYFVNEIRCGERATPYSTIASMKGFGSLSDELNPRDVVPQDLGEHEIVIQRWLAEDLNAQVGDTVDIKFYKVGPSRALEEVQESFRIHSIVEMKGLAVDSELMPDFPGLTDSENCRDWEPGMPVDMQKIRDKDESYWDEYGGAPKGFISLSAGQRLWSNRFGNLTSVRVSLEDQGPFEKALKSSLTPSALGLFFRDIGEMARASGTSSTDFGGLFIGLSFFLILSALLLTGMLFILGAEQRSSELGLLLALGYKRSQVRRLLLAEGLVLATIGSSLGVLGGILYTRGVLYGLSTLWRSAIGETSISMHVQSMTVGLGALGALVAAMGTMTWALRRLTKRDAIDLLRVRETRISASELGRSRLSFALWLFILGTLSTFALCALADPREGLAASLTYFGAGSALLTSLLSGTWLLWRRSSSGRAQNLQSVYGLSTRNLLRRRGRSLATVILLACGSFLVLSIGVHHLGPPKDPRKSDSGTGGFVLMGESTLPVFEDLSTQEGEEAYGIPKGSLDDLTIVPLRVRDGDEASCLNLNLAQQPKLVGVSPIAFSSRGSFRFSNVQDGIEHENPWTSLSDIAADGAIPAIGDASSVTYAMKKSVGDTIEYRDERGQAVQVRIVATVAGSILQGMLVVDSFQFERLYPSESGYRMFLIEGQDDPIANASKVLTRHLVDVGFQATPTADRLASFNAVQNTYLMIFQLLGGLGLLLGSVGLGLVVLRNILERRRELALIRALGYRRSAIWFLVMAEHSQLLFLGLGAGVLSALLAVLPALLGASDVLPWTQMIIITTTVSVSGILWVVVATSLALRGALLGALRNE